MARLFVQRKMLMAGCGFALATMLFEPWRIRMNTGAVPGFARLHFFRPLPAEGHRLVERDADPLLSPVDEAEYQALAVIRQSDLLGISDVEAGLNRTGTHRPSVGDGGSSRRSLSSASALLHLPLCISD
jgi:hypothetical protein